MEVDSQEHHVAPLRPISPSKPQASSPTRKDLSPTHRQSPNGKPRAGSPTKKGPRVSRRTRNASAKKGGAGGKGTWGRPGDELAEVKVGKNDPNYDPDEDETDVVFDVLEPSLAENEIEEIVTTSVKEYFDTLDAQEVSTAFKKLNFGDHRHAIVEHIINISLDRADQERELASILISELYGMKIISRDDIDKGLNVLLLDLAELKIDLPDAVDNLGKFIARAIADDCLPPIFVDNHPGRKATDTPEIVEALNKAYTLLHMQHAMARLDQVWGVHYCRRPVKYLVNQIIEILEEYIDSDDIQEVERCLHALNVPHFHHEVVYEAVNMVLEHPGNERYRTLIIKLLSKLVESVFLTVNQIEAGFHRIYEALPDIYLDVPNAYTILAEFTNICQEQGIVSKKLLEEMPQHVASP